MSMTLDELMEIHPPGTKFTSKDCDQHQYFECYYKPSKLSTWRGLSEKRVEERAAGDNPGWSIYVEPPRKVKKWLWARPSKDGTHAYELIHNGDRPVLFGDLSLKSPDWVKIPGTEIEVEDTP